MPQGSHLHRLALPLIAILLAACSTPPTKTGKYPLPPSASTQQGTVLTPSQGSGRISSILQGTRSLLNEQRYREAAARLSMLYYDNLPATDKPEYALQRAQVAIHRLEAGNAFLWLDQPEVLNNDRKEARIRFHRLRAEAYSLYGEHRAATDEWFTALSLAETSQEQESLYQVLWGTLIQLPPETLREIQNQTNNGIQRGWLALASTYITPTPLNRQIQNLQQWQLQWPAHPAQKQLGQMLSILGNARDNQPRHIALLLPLSGSLQRAGEAVRNGFMAAFYNNPSASDKAEISFYDTNSGSLENLINEAQKKGADLAIGPLSRDNVEALYKFESPIPILSLNYTRNPDTEKFRNIIQFGLSPEGEAIQAARRARLDGHERVVILTADSDWGSRVANSFRETWEALDGVVAGETSYDRKGDITQTTGKLLLVDESNKRSTQLQKAIRQPINFSGRRRQDVDIVFIAANPSQARQINPALAYQFAGKLPAYTISSVYSGATDTARDADLNGIRLPLMPWLSPESNLQIALKAEIEATWPDRSAGGYSGLYALGADSWLLQPRLQQLKDLPGSRVEGSTGNLHVKNNQVRRELNWYVFRGGRPRPLSLRASKRNQH